MKTNKTLIAAVFACSALLLVPASASPAAKPTISSRVKSASVPYAWPPETISGAISMVEPGQRRVVIDSDKVPFDMIVAARTHIMKGQQALTLKDLSRYADKSVTIRFVPERRGDVAESIRTG